MGSRLVNVTVSVSAWLEMSQVSLVYCKSRVSVHFTSGNGRKIVLVILRLYDNIILTICLLRWQEKTKEDNKVDDGFKNEYIK